MTGRALRRGIALLALAVGTSACSFQGLYNVPLPGDAGTGRHIDIHAQFADVLDLVPNSSVRINGVTVGSVSSVTLQRFGQIYLASVTMRVPDADAATLPYDTIAILSQTSLLGEKFVELEPDPTKAPYGHLEANETLSYADQQTSEDATVEQVFGALSALLNGGGIEQIQSIATELNQALSGREGDVRGLFTQLSTFVANLDQQKGNIVAALDGLASLSGELSAQRQVLATSLTELGPGLAVLADQRGAIVSLLQALAKLDGVSSQVILASEENTAADLAALRPILAELDQAGPALPHALELALDFPFPAESTAAIPGDYTKLSVLVDLASFSSLAVPAQLPVTVPKAAAGAPAATTPGLPGSKLTRRLGGVVRNLTGKVGAALPGSASGLGSLLAGML